MVTPWKHKVPACIANKYGPNWTSPFLEQSRELIKVKETVSHHSGFQVMQAFLWLAGWNAICRASSQYHVLSFQRSCCKGALMQAEPRMKFPSWLTIVLLHFGGWENIQYYLSSLGQHGHPGHRQCVLRTGVFLVKTRTNIWMFNVSPALRRRNKTAQTSCSIWFLPWIWHMTPSRSSNMADHS